MKRLASGLLVGLLLLSACGGTSPAATPAESSAASPKVSSAASSGSATATDTLPALTEAAKKEGRLTLSWAPGILVNEDGVKQLAEGFNKAYGLGLKVEYTPGPASEEMAPRLIQELQTNRAATTDMMFAPSASIAPMYTNHALLSSNWSDWAPNIKNAGQIAPQGLAIEVQTAIAGITFNTTKIKGDLIPSSMKDLLKPQYRGRLATTPYVAGFDRLATSEVWGKDATFDYVTKLNDQIGGLIRCNELQRLISGEFDLLAFNCDQGETLRNKAKGAPLDFVVAQDAPFITSNYISVPANAAHPAAAKLWVNYLLSPEAQKTIYSIGFLDSAQVSGSQTAALVGKYKDEGVTFINTDLRFYDRNDLVLMKQNSAQMQKMLQKK